MNIFVGNLAREVSEQDLKDLFSTYGNVRSTKVIRDLFSGESKGFGFVELDGARESQTAMNELNTKEVKGKKIVVNEARPKTDSRKGGGGFNRNGGSFNRGSNSSGFGRNSGSFNSSRKRY